jgi:hypothetical protein
VRNLPVFIGFTILAAAAYPQSAIIPASTGHGAPTFNCALNDTYGDMDSSLVWKCQTPPTGWVPTPQFAPWGGTSTMPFTASDAILKGPRVDPRAFGAKDDGVTDDCNALTAASNYAASVSNGVFYLPYSPSGSFATSCAVTFQSNWYVEGSLKAIAGGTAASTALISTGNIQTLQNVGIYGPGTLNGNAISPIIVWVRTAEDFNVNVGSIDNMAVNGKGVYFGDDAGTGFAPGYGGRVYLTQFGLHSNPTSTGSICVYISGGNGTTGQFTDNYVSGNILHGCSIGWQDHVGGNDRFEQNHAWDQNMTVCFDLEANGATLLNEYCDTPTTYGYHIHGLNTAIIGGLAFNGTTGSLDNVATAIQFDTPSDPQALVTGVTIYGTDSSHRWAADTNLGFSTTHTTWCDIRNETNIVTVEEGNNCLRGGGQLYTSGVQMRNSSTVTYNGTTYACSTSCNFNGGGAMQVANLSQNATSTWTVSTPSGAAYAYFTFLVCEPSSGGPFTFSWPASFSGFGSISGTLNSKCAVQDGVWNGTVMRATGPIQINE